MSELSSDPLVPQATLIMLGRPKDRKTNDGQKLVAAEASPTGQLRVLVQFDPVPQTGSVVGIPSRSTDALQRLANGQLAALPVATLYTATAKVANVCLWIVNTDSTNSYKLTLHHIQSGGSASASNQLANAVPIPPNGRFPWPFPIGMAKGDFFQAGADVGNKLTATVYGLLIV